MENGNSGKLTTSDLAYIAGLFDGEGCVEIRCCQGSRNLKYNLRTAVGNTNQEIITWLHSLFGGGVTTIPARARRKASYSWQLTGDKAAEFLRLIQPYSRIKARHIATVLEFWSVWKDDSHGNRWHGPAPQLLEIAEDYRSLVKALNRKGDKTMTLPVTVTK